MTTGVANVSHRVLIKELYCVGLAYKVINVSLLCACMVERSMGIKMIRTTLVSAQYVVIIVQKMMSCSCYMHYPTDIGFTFCVLSDTCVLLVKKLTPNFDLYICFNRSRLEANVLHFGKKLDICASHPW